SLANRRLANALDGDITRGAARAIHSRSSAEPVHDVGTLRPVQHQSQDGLQVARSVPRRGPAWAERSYPRAARVSSSHGGCRGGADLSRASAAPEMGTGEAVGLAPDPATGPRAYPPPLRAPSP